MENTRLKLFISYSHEDESHIKEFKKHTAPLKDKKLISEWYDREIVAGRDFQKEIDNNLKNADIICLFISSDFLASESCKKERDKAIELEQEKGVSIVPIILSECGWKDDDKISNLLAIPTDGKPISDFENSDKAWKNVYEELKQVITNINKIRSLKITSEFENFLNDAEMLTKAHPDKKELRLEDIFIFPKVSHSIVEEDIKKDINSKDLIDKLLKQNKILIAGENQSGKTTLCKRLYKDLKAKFGMIPIYIKDKEETMLGDINNRINKAFKEQYKCDSFNDFKDKIVIIIDDFYKAKHKEQHIKRLSCYKYQIIITDDIFCLNFKDENLSRSYAQYKIKEWSPTMRNDLIRKWISLKNGKNENEKYKDIDQTTALINNTLGKVLGAGIMPPYPFFILMIISNYETGKPLDEKITSQGHCYQALIYFYLRKIKVKEEDIGDYLNLLTEIAFYCFKKNKKEIPKDEFENFMKSYKKIFNFTLVQNTVLNNLNEVNFFKIDSLGNYSFSYPYLYYFFAAKYLAENLEKNNERIKNMLANLYKNENAYIAIFISHHTKDDNMIDHLALNAMYLFDKFTPATLDKEEVEFFDDNMDHVIQVALTKVYSSPETERNKKLEEEDKREETKRVEESNFEGDKEETIDTFGRELRRSIKTVEVMGRIVKNRSGSMKKDRLIEIFGHAMEVYLRILSSFFSLIRDEKLQSEFIDFISYRLQKLLDEKKKNRKSKNYEKLDNNLLKIAKKIFWNFNFSVIYGCLNMIIQSLGSDKLLEIAKNVCDKNNTPVAFIVKHGIYMWYNKNLQLEVIKKETQNKSFSELAKRVIKLSIVNYCSMHAIDSSKRQQVANYIKIPNNRLLPVEKR